MSKGDVERDNRVLYRRAVTGFVQFVTCVIVKVETRGDGGVEGGPGGVHVGGGTATSGR